MTYLALTLSHYVNGVAKRHGEVSQHMFGSHKIDSITNGVHGPTWVSEAFAQLYDLRIPGWRADSSSFRYALGIPADGERNNFTSECPPQAVLIKSTGSSKWLPITVPNSSSNPVRSGEP